VKSAYREFEERLGQVTSARGEKTRLILDAIHTAVGDFSVADLRRRCPGVSLDLIRRVLKRLQKEKQVQCLGRGQNAKWRKTNA
jgi:hypothetical protein